MEIIYYRHERNSNISVLPTRGKIFHTNVLAKKEKIGFYTYIFSSLDASVCFIFELGNNNYQP
jgi:hypothetical protein